MPDTGQSWPQVERLVKAWLDEHTSAVVCTERPADFVELATSQGVVRIERVGGAGDVAEHQLVVELEVTAAGRGATWTLVDVIESAMTDLTADGNGEGFIDEVDLTFLFATIPAPHPSLTHATGTFTLTVRPQ